MTEEEFRALVARAEREAVADPAGHRRRLRRLAALGDVCLGALALALLLPALFLVWAGFAGPAAASAPALMAASVALLPGLLIACSLVPVAWGGFERSWGTPVAPEDAPELFALLDRLRERAGGPAFDRVLVCQVCNIGLAHIRRLAALGRLEHHLLLGLELMLGVAPALLEAMVAREYGYLAKVYWGPDGWAQRAHLRWQRVERAARGNSPRAILLKPLVRWYVPRFVARRLPLGRAGEYEADRFAAEVAGSRLAADALVAASLLAGRLDRFWTAYERRASRLPQQERRPAREFARFVGTLLAREASRTRLAEVMALEPGLADAHPSPRERLEALAEAPRLPAPHERSAAEHFLGPALDRLLDEIDEEWSGPGWDETLAEAYPEEKAQADERAELEAAAARGPLDPRDANRLASLKAQIAPDDEALALCREVLARNPDETDALLRMGEILMHADDEEGIRLIERAMANDTDAFRRGDETIREYLYASGREAEAEQHAARWEERSAFVAEVEDERSRLARGDEIGPHGLSDEAVRILVRALGDGPEIRRAWLVRKQVEHLAEAKPCFVFCVEASWWDMNGEMEDYAKAFGKAARSERLPAGDLLVVRLSRRRARWLVPRLEQVPGSLVIAGPPGR